MLPIKHRRLWTFARLGLLLALLIMTVPAVPLLAGRQDPITAAWQAAQAAGSYRFTSDVTQVTQPLATLTNVGRASRTEKLYLEGQNELAAQRMEFTLWSQGGSALDAASGLSIRSEKGKTFARRAGSEWQATDDLTGAIAPQGDFLNYLAAIKDVQAQPGESRGGIAFTRYTFTIDSPRFATYMHSQMEAALRARGELPPQLHLEVPTYFRDMVGTGELWVGADGLPLRQILTLQFPPQNDEQVQSQIVVDFTSFGRLPVASAASGAVASGQWDSGAVVRGLMTVLPSFTVVFALVVLTVLLLYCRRTRLMQTVVVALVIFAQVAGPLLSTYTNVHYFDAQTAKAAAAKERQVEAKSEQELRKAVGTVAFNPHLSPLERARQEDRETGRQGDMAMALQSPNLSIAQSPALQTTDSGLDTDGDTLTDFAEARIGTSTVISDTDSDGLKDNVEVKGFDFGGQHWFSDPEKSDSNGDGLGDALEWGFNANGSLRTIAQDTDNDGIPDLFDTDNDNDAVPDNKDVAPFSKGAATFDEASPLQLTLKNLTPGKPTFVEFQLRPQNEKQLWFAYNVLDWPQDSLGQMRDIDGKSYAAVAGNSRQVAANEANGDTKLVPMLEIRIPTNSANLPPQSDLTPFNISLNNFTSDGQTKVAYVPLSILTDEKTGQRVAFSGQMPYLPTGSWNTPHQVRLAWVVQGLVDFPCDVTDSAQVAQGCQADGYIHNVNQPLQTYYSQWSLTGLSVREDHGATIAIAYEDPTRSSNVNEAKAIWGLSFVLDHHFVLGRDDNQDSRRDLTIQDLAPRFDLDNNPSEAQRFSVPNVLHIQTQSYPTFNQAVAFTAMTSTVQILNNVFKPLALNNRSVKPLLLFAQESSARALTLDGVSAGGYVVQSGGALTLDMAPANQPAQSTSVIAGLKWTAYCTPASGDVAFQPCTADEYWNELEASYGTMPLETGETDPTLPSARLMMAQFYYMGFSSGYQHTVQDGPRVLSANFAYDGESTTATKVRASLQGIAHVPLVASYSFGRVVQAYVNSGSMVKSINDFMDSLRNSVNLAGNAKIAGVERAVQIANARRTLFLARVAPLAAIGTVLMVITQIVSMLPDLPPTTRTVVGSISIILNIGLTVLLPIVEIGFLLQGGLSSTLKVLTETFKIGSASRIGGLVGLALSVLVIWGFFFYAMASSNLKAGDPALNRAFFEAVAATIVAVLLTILASNPIGLLIGAILGVIDLILTLICEVGTKALRQVPGLDGACFTLTGAVTKALTKILYSYDLMVDMARSDLMVTNAPQVALTAPNKGYIVGNSLSITLPLTTTIVNKNPDPNNGVIIYSYMYLFSQENLKHSSFKYSLTTLGNDTPDVALYQMTDRWQNVRERNEAEGGKYLLSPMYRADMPAIPAPSTTVTIPVVGINATVPLTLNMAYAIPAYECWTAVVVPVCYVREYKGDNHMPIDSLVYDVFPATLDEFIALTAKPGSGFGLAWSAQFPTLRDADGDGLISAAYNGSDPNDNAADSDNDGLTDRFELEKQAAGQRSSPIQIDSDSDGLTDFQEARLGTNPAAADSDNDGLKDGEEVYHLRYDPTTGLPTTIWEGGWSVTINAATPFTVRVSADPLNADGDNDGVNDLAERQLAQDANPANRVDNQNRPYHPNIVNTPPLAVLVATDDLDGYVAPGQSFRYTSTVIANTAVAPGILTVNAPAVLGGNPNPLALRFEPLTFNTAQTITQAINQVVGAGIGTQAARISSMVNTRLPNTGPGGWRFAPITAEAPLTGLSYYSAIAASRPDRQDSYWLNNLAIAPANSPTAGDLLAYSIPGGTVRAIENDNNNTWSLLHPAKPSLAANGNGDTVAVWGQQRLCNVMTINSLKVVTAGPRPLLTFQTGGGSEDNAWAWTQGTGGGNVASGTQFGPNANGFPVRLVYCGNQTFLRVYNYNNPPTTPNTLINTKSIDPYNPSTGLLTFSGAGATIEVSVSIPLTDSQRIGGTLLGADGTLKRSLNFPTSPIPKVDLVQNRNPVVASDGNGFLAAYESFSTPYGAATWGRQQVVLQAFDQAGNALGQSAIDAGSLQTAEFNPSGLALAAVWEGSSYRIVWQNRAEARIWQVRANANGQLLSSRESLATDAQILVSDALSRAGMTYAPSLAYDPLNNRTLLTYLTGNRQIKTVLYIGNSVSTQLLNSGALSPQVAWHPGYQGWLLSYQDSTTPSNHFFIPLNRDGAPAFPSTSGFTVATAENSLACPAPQSAPVVDLRWEELPGDNALSDGIRFGFYDSSGYGNHALCRLPGCPAAGVSGAPNAPLSDYAVQFDGVDDGLEFTRPVQDNFTIAFWLKAPTMDFGIASLLVDGGDPAANGFNIWLISGSLVLDFTGTAIEQSGRIDDGAWHFVTVSRNKSTGRVEAYVDGNSVVGVTGTAGLALNGAPGLVIGKGRDGSFPLRATLDHFQIIPTVLAQDAIQAIYNRTNQSYCLAAGAANNNLYWSKVQASQPDVRGGRISASNGLTITIDSDRPTASFSNLPNGAVVAPGQVIGGSASDATSGVGSVAVSINNGAWLTATGANSWAFSLAGYSGAISLRVRATDNVGNVGNPSAALNLTVDNVAPTLTINTPATTLKPSKNAAGRWQVPLNGTANDANGIQPASLLVNLQQQSAVGVAQSTQPATLSGSNWSSNYLLNDGLYDPTGAYTVTVQAADRVGNRATPATTVVRLDARGPEAVVSPAILARQVITPTLLINGVVSDTNSIAGIDKLEIAFTPIEQIAALPPGLTSEQAEALLNRTWMPVTLAQRGAGVTRTTWSFRIPAGLENSYQLDLRGFDLLGNVAISSNVWRGIIDTRVPRTAMRATVTGASYFDTARNQRLYEVRFLCGAQDRYLNESTFTCPGEGLAEPVRTFDNNPAIQALFPDLTIRTGLALSYTLWVTSTTPAATVRACDRYGRCGTTAIGAAVAAGAAVGSTTTDGEIVDSANIDGAIMEQVEVGEIVAAAVVAAEASASAPMAVIVNPTHRSFVAAGNGSTTSAISVTVAAEAGAGLKDVTIKLDNATVQTLSFAQSPAITRTVRTINVPVTTEG
ncbi:MAG: LamG-like jellyroll fold domain-containing protein, partial [Caldilineaceae bacterium]